MKMFVITITLYMVMGNYFEAIFHHSFRILPLKMVTLVEASNYHFRPTKKYVIHKNMCHKTIFSQIIHCSYLLLFCSYFSLRVEHPLLFYICHVHKHYPHVCCTKKGKKNILLFGSSLVCYAFKIAHNV